MKFRFLLASAKVILLGFFSCNLNSQKLLLPPIFSSGMVLQQQSIAPVWGKAQPGSRIRLQTSWGADTLAIAGGEGDWRFNLSVPTTVGRPQEIRITSSDSIVVLRNVLLGEVWLCSGQSNMEMPVRGWLPNDPIKDAQDVIDSANFPQIRMFTVERNKAFMPLDTFRGSWAETNPENVQDFSAVAYFFGLELYRNLGVPIGLIHSSWSGSPAESWVASETLSNIDGFQDVQEALEKAEDPNLPMNKWRSKTVRKDQNNFIQSKNFNFMDSSFTDIPNLNYNDRLWDTVKSANMDKVFQRENFNGMVWFRKEFTFNGDVESSDYELVLGQIEDLSTIFLNGELVGRLEHWGEQNTNILYRIPKGLLIKGKNVLAVRVIDVWDRGGILTQTMLKDVQNEIVYDLNDTWRYLPAAILLDEDFYLLEHGNPPSNKHPELYGLHSHTPSVLFNAMVSPLVPYALKGAIWYQGESNINRAEQYRTLFPAVFKSWRNVWGIGDFPFYYVQLAPFNYGNDTVALLREVQLETLHEPNVGMVVTTDVGSSKTIHPPDKQTVGKRLALWALAKDYGFENLVYSGPINTSVTFSNNEARLYFNHIGSGLFSPDSMLTNFEIAGSDFKFKSAKAVIKDSTVVVSSLEVPNPKVVRYAWDDLVSPNLFNREGLPTSPFRTSTEIKRAPDSLYPSAEIDLKYHSNWTKQHYKDRIQEFKQFPLENGDVVFLGNSITEGGSDWSLKFGIPNIRNRGISGDVTDGILNRLDEVIYFKPRAVFLLIGINDLFNYHIDKKVPSPEYVGNNILKIAAQLVAKSPQSKIYIQTILPTSQQIMSGYINAVNSIITDIPTHTNIEVIDLYSLFANEQGLMKDDLTSDGTHLNEAGYKVWVERLRTVLSKISP